MEEEKIALYKNGLNFNETKNKLLALLGNNKQIILINKNGEEAKLSRTSIGKLMSNAAIKKSMDNGFTREQHYAVASDIDYLFRNSVKLWQQSDKYGNPNVIIHRFATSLNFDNATTYITIKESKQHNGKRIYSIELMEIGKLEGMLEEARKNSLTLFPASSVPDYNI